MARFRLLIYTNRKSIRGVVWAALVLGVGVNILSETGDGFTAQRLRPLGIALFIAMVAEFLLFLVRPRAAPVFSESQLSLLRQIPEMHTLVSESTELIVLGGTLKTFTDDGRTVQAVASAIQAGRPVRILLMHPFGGGVESTVRARRSAGKSVLEDDLRAEIRSSISRLVDSCGSAVLNCIRLYREHPTYSVHCFGNRWLVTVYTMGRGASSPAIFFESGPQTDAFANGLRQGFEELWRAPTTETLDWPQVFNQLGPAPVS